MNTAALQLKLKNIKENINKFNDSLVSITIEDDKTICKKGSQVCSVPIVPLRKYQKLPRSLIMNDKIRRIFDVLPRRAGKEVESWQILIESAIRKPGYYIIMYPELAQGRRIIWNGGITLENGDNFSFIDMIPKFLIVRQNSIDMTIRLWNKSVIQILGSDKGTDKHRGINARGAVFSEFAYQDPRTYQKMMPVFRQNKGWIFLQTTFDGVNHAYNYFNENKSNDKWFTRLESVDTLVDDNNNRYITDEMIQEDRDAGMAEFLIKQEYYNIVSLNEDSMYFAKAMCNLIEEGRIKENCYIPGNPVYTACDLGRHDDTVLIMFQLIDNIKPNIIWSISGKDNPYIYYLNEAKSYCIQKNIILDTNFAPHDVKNRNETTITALQETRNFGFNVIACPRPINKLTTIMDMRNMLYRTIIDKKCQHLINCLSNYKKEYNEKMNTYSDKARHDWASHGVDAFQTMTIAINKQLIPMSNYGIVNYL